MLLLPPTPRPSDPPTPVVSPPLPVNARSPPVPPLGSSKARLSADLAQPPALRPKTQTPNKQGLRCFISMLKPTRRVALGQAPRDRPRMNFRIPTLAKATSALLALA